MNDLEKPTTKARAEAVIDETAELKEWVSVAIVRNTTTRVARRSPLFEFTRILRGHPALRNLDALEAAQAVEQYLREYAVDEPVLGGGVWQF